MFWKKGQPKTTTVATAAESGANAPLEVDAAAEEARLKKIAKRPAAFPRVLATSAEKGLGIPELRAEIVAACLPPPL
mgnify:CR=1 FL=1